MWCERVTAHTTINYGTSNHAGKQRATYIYRPICMIKENHMENEKQTLEPAIIRLDDGLVRCVNCKLYVEPMLASPHWLQSDDDPEVSHMVWLCDDCWQEATG